MSVYRKVRAVEKLFRDLDGRISEFQNSTGLKCIAGCGKCCLKPDIEATVLEFLPFAWHVFKSGQIDDCYDRLSHSDSALCMILAPALSSTANGFCTSYEHRGLICRLFGFSARRNKYNSPELFTCRLIKDEQPEKYLEVTENIKRDLDVPVVTDYYMKLKNIDPEWGTITYPINEAIRKAMEVVLNYYYFRKLSAKNT